MATGQRIAHLDARRRAVHVLQRGRVSVEQERLVVVVHREGAARPEELAHRRHRLGGEEEVLEPQAALAGEQGERVGQGEQDQVVLTLLSLDKGPAVVDMDRHPGVLVRMARVVARAEVLDDRVDLDRIDVLGAVGQRDRDVVAVPGSDDEDSVERRLVDVPVREGVERLEVEQGLDVVGGLVGDVVGRDGQRVVGFDASDDLGLGGLGRHLVVGRPVVIRSGRLDPEHDDDHDEAEQLQSPPEQHDEQRGGDGAPHDRRLVQEGQH